jgi:hypothetical protein
MMTAHVASDMTDQPTGVGLEPDMDEIIEVDLTAIEGEPSLRAEVVVEWVRECDADADDLAIRSVTIPRQGHPNRAVHRTIVAVDIKDSTKRANAAKGRLRQAMYELLESAFRAAGITDNALEPLVDRGDSALALIRPADEVPKSLILDTAVPTLLELLTEHNQHNPDRGFQLRVVVHAGEVHKDPRGWFGEDLDLAFRLLDAPELKRRLDTIDQPMVLVVSEAIYRSIANQGYPGIDATSFEPAVRVRLGDRRVRGWVQLVGRLSHAGSA